ncbi:hypothetical protein [Propioniciclava sp.]|uniref:hypothetical protein n=1 Tax=Propioniciclava sp. TaxID=2038686 RepID=UPI00262C6E80|nr:hypothetical protein [Propioniciclava sp.]
MAVPVVGMAPSRKASATKACVSAGLIASDEGAWSASSLVAQADDPAALLGTVVACYLDAVGVAAERTLTDEDRARIEWAGAFYGLVEEEAWPTLRAALAMRAPDGEDPVRVLLDAVAWAPLTALGIAPRCSITGSTWGPRRRDQGRSPGCRGCRPGCCVTANGATTWAGGPSWCGRRRTRCALRPPAASRGRPG